MTNRRLMPWSHSLLPEACDKRTLACHWLKTFHFPGAGSRPTKKNWNVRVHLKQTTQRQRGTIPVMELGSNLAESIAENKSCVGLPCKLYDCPRAGHWYHPDRTCQTFTITGVILTLFGSARHANQQVSSLPLARKTAPKGTPTFLIQTDTRRFLRIQMANDGFTSFLTGHYSFPCFFGSYVCVREFSFQEFALHQACAVRKRSPECFGGCSM